MYFRYLITVMQFVLEFYCTAVTLVRIRIKINSIIAGVFNIEIGKAYCFTHSGPVQQHMTVQYFPKSATIILRKYCVHKTIISFY